MRYPATVLRIVVAAGGCTAAIVVLLAWDQRQVGPAGAGLVICWLCFCLWPWAVLPVGLIGGAVVSALLGQDDVRGIALTHTALLLAGCAALATRRLVGAEDKRPRPPGQSAMLAVLVVAALGAVYGLAVGNAASQVLVATYLVAVIPFYFLIAMYTLATPNQRAQAGLLYVIAIGMMTALEFGAPGRHGGLLSLIPIPPLVVLAGQHRGWRRWAAAFAAAVLATDVVLASYRGVWLAGGVAVLIMLVRGGRVVRHGLVAAMAVAGPLAGLVVLAGGLEERASVIGLAVGRSAGYRLPEAAVGWDVFARQPLFGAGLGQTTPQIYIPGFEITDVGPVYHAFYVLLLANLGIVGLCLVIWPIVRSAWAGFARREEMPVAYAALTCGFLAAAFFSGPTDGHWELGLLPALTLLTSTPQARTWPGATDRLPFPPTQSALAGAR